MTVAILIFVSGFVAGGVSTVIAAAVASHVAIERDKYVRELRERQNWEAVDRGEICAGGYRGCKGGRGCTSDHK